MGFAQCTLHCKNSLTSFGMKGWKKQSIIFNMENVRLESIVGTISFMFPRRNSMAGCKQILGVFFLPNVLQAPQKIRLEEIMLRIGMFTEVKATLFNETTWCMGLLSFPF